MNQYDAVKATIYDQYFTGVDGDTAFYVEEAIEAKGTVLELGCGTGRITFALANANVRVVGLDSSAEMLAGAQEKADKLDPTVRKRVRLVAADMRTFDLSGHYRLIILPYRTFMHILTPQEQVQTLIRIREHLAHRGRVIIDLYEPTLEQLRGDSFENILRFDTEFIEEQSGHRVLAWYRTQYDITNQIIDQLFYFDEVNERGTVISRYYSPLTLRYSHRYEMHYLLELCGFQIDELYGDFYRRPFVGSKQIWIAHKA
jgi:ubiquinone/menaquinone biosynthesis C-methylase UbiE